LLAEIVGMVHIGVVMVNGKEWGSKSFVLADVIIKEKERRRLLVGYQYLTPNS